jgi:demethylmenaquinone methyltransferase / 2-methoxy-6-polyprenyl-1,4-benzoquinol methylase
LLQSQRGFLGVLDAWWILCQTECHQFLAELFELTAARTLLGQLAHRSNRDRSAHGVAIPHRLPGLVEDEPGPIVSGQECAEIRALAGIRLRRHDARQLLAGLRERHGRGGGAVEIVPERHRARIDSGPVAVSERNRLAQELFAPLGPTYDRWSRLLSLGQDPRWRRYLVSRIEAGPDDEVLDVATGTAAVAIELARRTGCKVVGLDQSHDMLAAGRERVVSAGLGDRIRLVEGSAEHLPFDDASFDGLTFTYLLRYVEDPATTLGELARVVRPGRMMAALEFGLPRGLWRLLWELYVRVGLPVAGRLISPGWHEVGAFLGPSIRAFHDHLPVTRQIELWREAGFDDVRTRSLSLGGGYVVWGRRR